MERSTASAAAAAPALQYRWVIIFYHAGKEDGRSYGDVWYNSLEECKKVAEDLDFDFCCGYSFEYESRTKNEESSA